MCPAPLPYRTALTRHLAAAGLTLGTLRLRHDLWHKTLHHLVALRERRMEVICLKPLHSSCLICFLLSILDCRLDRLLVASYCLLPADSNFPGSGRWRTCAIDLRLSLDNRATPIRIAVFDIPKALYDGVVRTRIGGTQ
jgi:hypothetical protein